MPVINGVYTKDFPALGRAPIDTDIIPIAELANQITYKTTLGELFNAKVFGTTGRLSKFTSANTLGNSILNEIGNAIHLTNAGSSYASFGIINPGTPGEPGIDNDAYIGSTINNDFTIRVNNVEAARFDTALRFKITTIQNATTDTDKFLVSDGGVVKYRTGAEVLSDIGAASASGYVPYSGATSNVNLGEFNITASSLIKVGGVDTQFLKADGSVDNNDYLTANDLPSTLSLYATNVAAAVAGYFKLVTTIDDPDYNTIAVDVPTGAITTTDQLIASLVSPVNLINGNPGVFNVTTIGNITRLSGSGEAEFYFKIYKRDSVGVETLIGTSSNTIPVINTGYSEFFATAIWNDGVFGVTDSIVLKYYATRLSGGSNPTYQFQFGGDQPVRTIVPIPTAVIPNIFLEELADVEDGVASNNDGIFFDSSVSLWKYKSVSEVLGYTPANDASVVHLDGTETITGRKTFNNVNGLTIDEVSGALVPTKIFSSNIQTLNYAVSNTSNNFLGTFLGTVTANRTYSIPDISGTLALTSQLHDAITLSAIGSTPNANGATLTGQVLNLQPASASFGGVITTGSQTIAGTKTFSVDAVVNGVNIGRGGGNIATNTRIGQNAGLSNTTGFYNSFIGYQSGYYNTQGDHNSFIGAYAGHYNTFGYDNSFIGAYAGHSNTTGYNNSAIGYLAGYANTSGNHNSFIGVDSGSRNTTGTYNLFIGYSAGNFISSSGNNVTPSNSIFLGYDTRALNNNETNQIVIGHNGRGLGSNTTVLGNSSTVFGRFWGNLLVGDSSNTGEALQITGNAKITGTITNGTYTYTLPSANGILALTSNLSAYLPLTGGTLTGALTLNSGVGSNPNFASTVNGLEITSDGSTASNRNIIFKIASTTALSIDNSTNVAIGYTTNPSLYKLDVNGTGRFTGALSGTSATFSDGTQGLIIRSYTGGAGYGAIYASTLTPNGSNPALIAKNDTTFLNVNTGGTLYLSVGTVSALTIASTGAATFSSPNSVISNNQGIRVYTNDALGADIGGGISFGGNYISGATADFANIKSGKDNSTSGNYAGYLAFSTNAQATGNVERMRITSGGNVLIGTTDNPGVKLNVNGDIKTSAPSGGTAKPFKVGAAATYGGAATFDRTIEIEIDGTTYYLAAKTTST